MDTMAAAPQWTRADDKDFESALVIFPEGSPYFLENIAQTLKKTVDEVNNHYNTLVHDVDLIESGKFVLPKYPDDDYVTLTEASPSRNKGTGKKNGIPWSQNEHRLFLEGLNKFGKGDWKNISRHCVKSRTSTQVASHAQKYFNRLKRGITDGKRSSIHDMTLGDVENVPGSNLTCMDQQPHFGDQISWNQCYLSQENFPVFR
ncbi:unnamed protein product [Arabidopsis lyrata]|nr:transcription factor DIVARICATA [Arabidopsis lyrata subsp. lyrata]CAH8272711.1 unnamed protein product [Arabidopsis lyrata]|eukprot:XP_002872443.2 transcription factor DIVARICATA [Arabidopsis lyrata subsp. lyrata]